MLKNTSAKVVHINGLLYRSLGVTENLYISQGTGVVGVFSHGFQKCVLNMIILNIQGVSLKKKLFKNRTNIQFSIFQLVKKHIFRVYMCNPYHVSEVKNLYNCENGEQLRVTLLLMHLPNTLKDVFLSTELIFKWRPASS